MSYHSWHALRSLPASFAASDEEARAAEQHGGRRPLLAVAEGRLQARHVPEVHVALGPVEEHHIGVSGAGGVESIPPHDAYPGEVLAEELLERGCARRSGVAHEDERKARILRAG